MTGQTMILTQSNRWRAHQLIDKAPERYVMEVREPRRTGDQNAKMWAMISDVSRAKPEGRRHTPDDWKAIFMHACGHEVQFEQGIDGRPFPTGFRSSRLSKQQMSDLIECIYEYGSRHGVQWSVE